MKRLSLLAVVLLAISVSFALPALAQDAADVITLNDAAPAIDVVVTLPPDTTGTIALEFSGAAVRLTDANGGIVFAAADARLHGLELSIAPNSGTHTLSIERLPDLAEALVRVSSLPELTLYGSTELVSGLAINPSQEISLPLTVDHPGDTVSVTIPGESVGMMTAMFPGAGATTQLVDAAGVVVADSAGGHVEGMSLLLDPGTYQFALLGSGLLDSVVAGIRLVAADDVGVTVMQAPESAVTAAAADPTACSAVVSVSSTDLHTGPGTGYTILGYGYRSQEFTVGGRNPEDNWLLVATNSGESAWVERSTVQTQGACTTLTTFNIPLRDAQPAPLVITAPGQSGGYNDDDHEGHGEYEGYEGGEREEGDDD